MGFRRTKLNWPGKEEAADCRVACERALHPRTHVSFRVLYRLLNSPYFCVFMYARAVKQKVWNEAENRE